MVIEDASVIKHANTSLIRKYMLGDKSLTKSELVGLTKLSFPTINKIIDEMSLEGEVLDLGLQKSTGGRRAKAYKLNPDYAYVLSMFITQGRIVYNIKNILGEIVDEGIKENIYEFSIRHLDELLDYILAKYLPIRSIAIGVPGSVKAGTITYIDCYSDLEGFNLEDYIVKKYKKQVIVENDMKAVTMGCYRRMENEDSQLATIYLGHNGPGCGIIVNGKILRGDKGFAGEIGFLPMYNEMNLQEIALKGLGQEIILDYLARLITAISVFVNPSKIILYENGMFPSSQKIEEASSNYLPKEEVPEIIISDNYSLHYLEGLYSLAYELIYPVF